MCNSDNVELNACKEFALLGIVLFAKSHCIKFCSGPATVEHVCVKVSS